MLRKIALTALLLQVISISVFSQTQTNYVELRKASVSLDKLFQENFAAAMKMAQEKGWKVKIDLGDGNVMVLVGINPDGSPLYISTASNVTAANTTGASQLWPGGGSGLNLSGSSLAVKNKLGIWDGGTVLASHQELIGRVTQMDFPSGFSAHATHVAGTMMASGAVNANAKGMAFGLQGLLAYDFGNDLSEMFGAASGLLVSNHSYGFPAGWKFEEGEWRWYGQTGSTEDYNFGYYDSGAQLWDSLAYNAPYYLMVKAAGNDRDDNGPAVGQPYKRREGANWVADIRPPGLSSNDSYGIIERAGNAKNILTVGAIQGLANGYQTPNGVLMSSFSCWGPTDDGRIKPDIVGMGVGVLSTVSSGPDAYGTMQGTSMASPNVAGSLLLLQEYYESLHPGNFMRAATLKGLAIHTAEEAGFAAGPDYVFGWGVLNVKKASDVIKSNNLSGHKILENVLNNGGSFSTTVMATGPLSVTISWTDPKGTVVTSNILNNPQLKLVHDLDVRVTRNSTTYMPWILEPSNPVLPATTGDNFRDNVEKIQVPAQAGEVYTITVTHKGNLARGSQAYSLIMSGIGGAVYCTSGATSSAGTRIDSVSISNIQKQNAAGCTTYTNNSASVIQLQPNQVAPLFVAVNSCDASSANKIVKTFVDWNADGDFTDANETVATSGVIAGNGNLSQNITVPSNVTVGSFVTMRIVAMETSNAADVLPCGTYANGETQDFVINIVPSANDMSIGEVVYPKANECENASQLVTVKLRNLGSATKSNIPVTAVVKNGATVVATLTATYTGTIAGGASANYTFQTPFSSVAGATYTIQAYVADPIDQVVTNDTVTANVTIASATPAPTGLGIVCNGNAILTINNPEFGANYFWYTDAASNTPFATGFEIATSTIPANNTYFVTRGAKGSTGLASKAAFPGGGYVSTTDLATSNYMRYSSTVPVILESAKIYSKQGGRVNIVVASISGSTINLGTAVTYPVDLMTTSSTPGGGNQPDDASDNGAVYQLNITLPPGDRVILVQTTGNTNIFRNDNVTGSPYPFTIPGLISFTGNNTSNFQNFYFYLYDMKLRTSDCVSARGSIVAPTAPTPVVTQVGDSLVSSIDNGNQWYLNNAFIPFATGKKYKPTASGSYLVKVNDAFGCQMTSAAVNVVLSSVVNLPSSEIKLVVAPNPSRGSFLLKFNLEKKEDLTVDLINIQGQKMSSRTYPKYQGVFSQQMSFKNLASGVYVLRIQHGSKVYHEKIIVE